MALAVGSAVLYWTSWTGIDNPSDFDQLWYGARALFAGTDPYTAIGPEAPTYFPFPLFYPLPALLAVAPLALLPQRLAGAAFVALSAGLLAWGVTRDGWIRLPLFLSGAFLWAVRVGQWTPLFLAALFLPALGVLAAVKPQVGLIVGAASPDRRYLRWATWGGAALLALAFGLRPTWVADWLGALAAAPRPFSVPLFTLPGLLLWLGLLRWRRADAWLLLALGAIPHTGLLYETLLLFAIPRSRREMLSLAILSGVAYLIMRGQWLDIVAAAPLGADGAWNIAAHIRWAADFAPWETALLYLPCLWMVLRRPNEGPGPAWLHWIQAALDRTRSPVPEPALSVRHGPVPRG